MPPTEKEMWIPTERVAKIIRDWMKQWEYSNPRDKQHMDDENWGVKAFCHLSEMSPRKVLAILQGRLSGDSIPYLNVSGDVVDQMLCNMGRTDLWHSELGDIYCAKEPPPRRRFCRTCEEIKTESDFRSRWGGLSTCRECEEKVAA